MGISSAKPCVFCHYKKEELLSENESLAILQDINPMARHHFLCIPKVHIKDINSLTKEHVSLLENMRKFAVDYITERFKAEKTTEKDVIFGFHVPPFTSVNHLHMHCLIPPYKSYIFSLVNKHLILRSVDEVIEKLKGKGE